MRLNAVALKALAQLQNGDADSGPVIRNRAGESLRSPRHWFEKAVVAAGIDDFHWRDLRHTFASRLAMACVGIRAIQEALGHKSIAMTVRYSHLSPDFLQDAVDKLAPQPSEVQSTRTDTTTDTAAASVSPQGERVH